MSWTMVFDGWSSVILLSKDVSLAAGVAALVCLVGLQYAVAWLSVRSAAIRHLARSEPRLLVRRGELLEGAAARERVSRDEVFAAIRKEGLADVKDVDALILETDGSFSVIPSFPDNRTGALHQVRGFERDR